MESIGVGTTKWVVKIVEIKAEWYHVVHESGPHTPHAAGRVQNGKGGGQVWGPVLVGVGTAHGAILLY